MINFQSGMTLARLEREAIEAAMKFYRGNKTHVALALGVSVKTIQNKVSQYEQEDKAKLKKVEKKDGDSKVSQTA